MFTVKIVKEDGSTSLRNWSSIDIHKKGTASFGDFVNEEKKRLVPELYAMMQGNEKKGRAPTEEESLWLEAIESYKCVISEIGTPNEYFLAGEESVYITDSSGNTVDVIR